MNSIIIGYAGLSHLGINSAAAAAARGFRTFGYDPDLDRVSQLTQGKPPIAEPELPALLIEHSARMSFGSDPKELGRCDIVYIANDVPTDASGRSDLEPIGVLIDTTLANLKPDALLVVLCQVPPGFTRVLKLDRARLYYQVETLVFGRAVQRALHPERFILGCAYPGQPIDPRLHTFLTAFRCPILTMRYESAEFAKIAINLCLIASLSVTNSLAEICEAIGADWSEIVPSLRLDQRIGPAGYITPGLGFAGGNLERDLATVRRLSSELDTDGGVFEAFLASSCHRKEWAWRILKSQVLERDPHAVIALLGLAYKENTDSTKNAPSLALLDHLRDCVVRVFDPVVPANAAGSGTIATGSMLDAAEGADAVCIMTPWPQFRSIDPVELKRRMRGRTVLDPFRVLDARSAVAAGLDYATLGAAPMRGSEALRC